MDETLMVEQAKNAMRLYGHPFRAANIIQTQIDSEVREERYVAQMLNRASKVVEFLQNLAKGYTEKYIGHGVMGRTPVNLDSIFSEVGLPLTPIGSQTLSEFEQEQLDEIIAAQSEYENAMVEVEYRNSKRELVTAYVKRIDYLMAFPNDKVLLRTKDGEPLVIRRKQKFCKKRHLFVDYGVMHE